MVDIITPQNSLQKRLQGKQEKYTDSLVFISIYAIKKYAICLLFFTPFVFLLFDFWYIVSYIYRVIIFIMVRRGRVGKVNNNDFYPVLFSFYWINLELCGGGVV